MAFTPPFMSMTTPAAPLTVSESPGTRAARDCSSASWMRRSTVVTTLPPGRGAMGSPVSGSVFQLSPTTLPSSLSSTILVPASPRR